MNEDKELRDVVQQLAEEEGISFEDALVISIKALRYEIQRRKTFLGHACAGGLSIS
ncbi:hypothetical protein [Rahnella woolbedingensis]|uniref:hypothetical protein n=1 Tax=Rahnella woolbedingensis TaxID=1510574 RepID=UPI00142D3172|nr:hypothetical protein [Rahnella woolbedingensis]